MAVPILTAITNWECPSCSAQERTDSPLTQPGHICPQSGLAVPMVALAPGQTSLAAGQVRHVAVEREDYVGNEHGMTRDRDGRVISAVRTERADGSNDVVAFAPIAVSRARTERQ